ncbi:MAG TPA: Ig-like domain-containing protein [Paenibacillus sp.]
MSIRFKRFLIMSLILLVSFANVGTTWAATELSKLVLSKNQLTLEVGESATLSATAVYTDMTTKVVTTSTEWTSGNAAIATAYNGSVTAKSEGTVTVIAVYGGISESVQVKVTKKVKALVKDVQNVDLRIGKTQDVILTATYSDNSTEQVSDKADWTSANNNIATVVNGKVTAHSSGTTTITAVYGKQTVSLEVTVEVVKRLDLSVPDLSLLLKDSKKVVLTAMYPDGESKDVTADAVWSSDNEDVADVIKGEITAYTAGTATITAEYGSKKTTLKVDVDKTRKLEVNKQDIFLHVDKQEQVKLTAVYPDGTSVEVTDTATWKSSNEAIAYVNKGLIHAEASGSATITGTYGEKSISIKVDIDVPRHLDISDEEVSLGIGKSKDLKLTATYADGTKEDVTSKAEWTSSDAGIAYVSKGKISAYKMGEVTITATYGGSSVTSKVKVDIVAKVALSAKTASIKVDKEYQVNLMGTNEAGIEENLNSKAEWSSSKSEVAEVKDGLIKGLATGTSTITALYNKTKYTMTISVGLVSSLEADTRLLIMSSGDEKSIKVTSTDAADLSEDVTALATWKSSNTSVASVNKGNVKGYSNGKSTITAEYGGQKVTITVEVDVISKIEASVQHFSMKSGDKEDVTITVTYSDGTTKDVSSRTEWKTSNYKVATVSKGNIKAISYGKTNIIAKFANKSITIPVNVDMLKYLQTNEVAMSLKVGEEAKVIATATYTDGTESNVSTDALWKSSKILTATVKDGKIKATGKGKATITVSHAGKKTKVVITVTE